MNKPNILSNTLDQVPKRGEWYRNELYNNPDLRQQIVDAFVLADFPMQENDFFIGSSEKEIVDRFLAHNEKLPMEQIAKMLRNVPIVSCEIQKKKKEKTSGWSETIGPAIPKDTINLGTVLTRDNEDIKGRIITYISFTKLNDKQQRPNVKITAKQIEFPGEGAMIPEGVVFQKELTGAELQQQEIEL